MTAPRPDQIFRLRYRSRFKKPTFVSASPAETAMSHEMALTPSQSLETGPSGRWNGGCVCPTPELLNGEWGLPYLAHTLPDKLPR
jgi:hypothetical protein